MKTKTILYYTANTEDHKFEAKIRKNILKQKGDVPIISVSQKPMDFGKNICVGDVGHSYLNMYRQILIGAKAAKTPYIILAECDFLYPESYFSFEPNGADSYRYSNVWIVFKEKLYSYRRKINSEGASIWKRRYIIKLLEEYLDGGPQWHDGRIQNKDKNGKPKKGTLSVPFELFDGDIACIGFKTGLGMGRQTNVLHGREYMSMKLPYWGHISTLRKEYL